MDKYFQKLQARIKSIKINFDQMKIKRVRKNEFMRLKYTKTR